ncbi:MAG: DNA-binding response regulator [Thalassolituus sp.]|jgi:two-component system response regulator AlgR|uniref:LytTR family DNA-binding domain-containing protein n=1 Tax=Thalassolituus maritimus TaxID=484498 RepID=A0ABP9ZXQ9_9GAMM|nr:LytTR family DNA-binding domain-containing protein [Pseudomonadota bacterium]MEC8104744.1 LytTR family DNA-binding domain-containing protein [Pseudomonadota bacterium]MEE2749221.1 LytTR family DNA-binding domain-containing protein [Pseudomonadota bacterium]TNC87052.1 MAG: DNA-binding response regulator [Thalassolituus sp.]|tara:strand:+ start:279 stop:995 length:717 start_codon:yes stop_codon:yes gene_type:complete
MSYRVLVVDDEPLARERLKRLLDEHTDFSCIAEAGDGQAAVDWLAQFHADLVLLDIQMPGLDGLQAAAQISQQNNPPVLVFCTAYDEHALSAFDVNAADYLLKPIRKEDLTRALTRAAERLSRQQAAVAARTHISARTAHGLVLTPIDEVAYFSADQKYVSMHHEAGETLIDDSLKQLEEEFSQRFLRIHRSYLVAAHRIYRLETTEDGVVLWLRDLDTPLPVSRRHVSGVKKYLRGV